MDLLFPHQIKAIDELETGSILRGDVGSGKSRTALGYWHLKVCNNMRTPKHLYIITTARKRDTKDWEDEMKCFKIPKSVNVIVDSWNNIKKYIDVKDAFFIFDEQRVVGYGTWTKAYFKIAKQNEWILLSATPGDVWMDYMPVFIANGFYKNKTDFTRMHVVFSNYSKYPKIERYVNQGRLNRFKKKITVHMKYERHTTQNHIQVYAPFNEHDFAMAKETRWNKFENKPIKDIAELYRVMRKIVNGDMRRVHVVKEIVDQHPKVIVFYNFNYELELLREMSAKLDRPTAEWNGHKHEPIPDANKWMYLVQYTAGAEGWNCVETNRTLFYSQNYSYKIMNQSAGRTDRLNSPYNDLYYYHIISKSFIDMAISKALSRKQNFHEKEL